MVLELLCSQEDLSYPQELFSSYYLQSQAADTMSTLGIYMNTENHHQHLPHQHHAFVDNVRHPVSEMHVVAPHMMHLASEIEDHKFLYADKDHKYCGASLPRIVLSSDSIQMQDVKQMTSRSSSDSCDQILSRNNMASQSSPSSSSSWKASDELEPYNATTGMEKRYGTRSHSEQGMQNLSNYTYMNHRQQQQLLHQIQHNEAISKAWVGDAMTTKGHKTQGSGEAEGKKPTTATKAKKKRNRGSRKTSEQVESQRMNHIAVERNRRRQMNEHLAVMRSLMPPSYVQRGDQASIIGGAIEFVKELEQILQSLLFQKMQRDNEVSHQVVSMELNGESKNVFEDISPMNQQLKYEDDCKFNCTNTVELRSSPYNFDPSKAQVEVKIVGSWAIVKVLTRKEPHQLLNALHGLQKLCLKVMHLNVTTSNQIVLYSFHIQVNAGPQILHVEDITKLIQSIFSMPSCVQ